MKKKDQILLENAYEQTLLNEGMLSSGIKAVLQPLFNNLFVKIKEKSPEAFAKLAAVKTPQELLGLINSYKQGSGAPQQHSEGIQDVIGKVKQAVASLVELLEVAGNIGAVFSGLGAIMSLLEYAYSGTPNYGMMLAGLLLVAIQFAANAGMAMAGQGTPRNRWPM